jgi:hypothetical protein
VAGLGVEIDVPATAGWLVWDPGMVEGTTDARGSSAQLARNRPMRKIKQLLWRNPRMASRVPDGMRIWKELFAKQAMVKFLVGLRDNLIDRSRSIGLPAVRSGCSSQELRAINPDCGVTRAIETAIEVGTLARKDIQPEPLNRAAFIHYDYIGIDAATAIAFTGGLFVRIVPNRTCRLSGTPSSISLTWPYRRI